MFACPLCDAKTIALHHKLALPYRFRCRACQCRLRPRHHRFVSFIQSLVLTASFYLAVLTASALPIVFGLGFLLFLPPLVPLELDPTDKLSVRLAAALRPDET
jgi:hypothetical protein